MTKDNIKDDETHAKSQPCEDFDSRGLDQQVIKKLASKDVKEAEMIAKFNAKVNEITDLKPDQSLKSPSKDSSVAEINEERGTDLDPTRYGDWERKGRCYDF